MTTIGDTLYTYDVNRRRYDGGQIDRSYHWQEHTITGETRICWVLSGGYKVDKKTLELRGIREFYGLDRYAYTPDQKADREWRTAHMRDIERAVEKADTAMLRKVAALLGLDR